MNQAGLSTTAGPLEPIVVSSIKAAFARDNVVWLVAFLVAILHIATAGQYDAQRNELYFLVCGRRPDFGYVDQPPLVPLIAAATQIFGINIWLLRLPATIAAIGLVFICAAFARLLGGKSRAVSFAAIAAGIAPGLAALTSHLTTSTFEPIAWTATAFLLTRALLHEALGPGLARRVGGGLAMEAKWGLAVWLVALAGRLGYTGTPHIALVAVLARHCHCSGARRAKSDLAMAARLAVFPGDPAASRRPGELYGAALAIRVQTGLIDEPRACPVVPGRGDWDHSSTAVLRPFGFWPSPSRSRPRSTTSNTARTTICFRSIPRCS